MLLGLLIWPHYVDSISNQFEKLYKLGHFLKEKPVLAKQKREKLNKTMENNTVIRQETLIGNEREADTDSNIHIIDA